MRTVVLSFCVLSALKLFAPSPAMADDEQAKRYFLEGKQAYLEGRYHAAVASFRAAAAIRPSPILEFNVGRCLEKLGKLDEAIASYEKYLATAKDAPNRAEVKARVAKLKEERRRQRSKDPYEDIEKSSTPAAKSAASRPAASRPASPRAYAVPPPQARAQAEPEHEAGIPRSWGGPSAPGAKSAAAAPTRAAPRAPGSPPPAPQRRDTTPVYKTWWFWVACVTGAALTGLFITTVVYASGGSSSSGHARPNALEIRF